MLRHLPAALILAAGPLLSIPSVAGDSEGETAIRSLLEQYQAALNASSTAQVLPLYADDGIFMWEFNPTVIGKPALRAAYDKVFQAITLKVKFTVEEVKQLSPDWAFARTHSEGTQTMKANGKTTAEGNQELFIFHKESNGRWQIARY